MGFAAPADDELADTVTVGRYLLRDKDASYLLEMSGDAMVVAGILSGDMVVFERSHDYRPGDIVVVLSEDGYSLQYFRKKSAAGPVQIVGVVTGTFRKYY
jgi:DNA polymerase V